MRTKSLVLLFAGLLSTPSIYSQSTEVVPFGEAWRWTTFTRADGLPSEEIIELVESSGGVPWVRTRLGVAWYDGFRWRDARRHGLPDAVVQDLAVGLDGQVLVVADRRLHRYSGGSFTPVASPESVAGQISSVAPVDDDHLLVLARGGRVLLLGPRGDRPCSPPTAAKDLLWVERVGTDVLLVTSSGSYLRTPVGWEQFFPGKFIVEAPGVGYTNWAPDLGGAYVWDELPSMERIPIQPSSRIHAAARRGNETIVSYSNGIVLHQRDDAWRELTAPHESLYGVRLLQFRPNGDLWVGNRRGLSLYQRSLARWSRLRDPRDPLREVLSVLVASDGTIWAGTTLGVRVWQPDGTVQRIDSIDGTPVRIVTGLAEDSAGHIWISSGSDFMGAFRWDGRSWKHFGASEGLATTHVHKMVNDRRGRLLLLGFSNTPTIENPGVLIYEDEKITSWSRNNELPCKRVYDVYEEADGTLWFATSRGLSRLRNGGWTCFRGMNFLNGRERVFTVEGNGNGKIFFGYGEWPGGIGIVEGDEIRHLTSSDGLANDYVWDLARGPSGSMWLATESGLSRYRQGTFVNFTSGVGLDAEVLWPIAISGHQVYVGTGTDGVYRLSLDEDRDPAPRISFSEPINGVGQVLVRWQASAFWGRAPENAILTRYRFDGGAWSEWSGSREALVLAPKVGDHNFEVQSLGLFGERSPACPSSFSVPPPSYLRPWALGLMGALVLGVGGSLVSFRRKQLAAQAHAEATRQTAQRRLLEAQKFESIGALAGGVAHDFNNLLTVIKGTAQLLKNDSKDRPATYDALGCIETAGERAAHLTRQLLTFGRKQIIEPRTLDVNEAIRSMYKMLRLVIGASIEIVTILPEEQLLAKVDPSELDRVLLNLAINARDAMPRGGKLTIAARAVELHEAHVSQHPGARRGPHVRLSMTDNGVGMDEATQQRIFDPFFTTKSGERGSGLGLSSCRAIVTEAGGHMDVVSTPGHETTFYVYLPVAPPVDSRPEKSPEVEPRTAAGETILVLDDEPDVRRVMVEALRGRGYMVLETSHGPDALTLLEERDEIALLITDLVLPLMSGEKVREQALRIRPELPVLIVTGFTHSVPYRDDITSYLGKPFSIQELIQSAAQLLTHRPTDPRTSV